MNVRIPRGLHLAFKLRAVTEGRHLRHIVADAMREYAETHWDQPT